jgi:hypothetical protein
MRSFTPGRLAQLANQRLSINKFGVIIRIRAVIMRIRALISEMKNPCPPPQPQLNFTDAMTLTFRH